jgi:hypothetical protein
MERRRFAWEFKCSEPIRYLILALREGLRRDEFLPAAPMSAAYDTFRASDKSSDDTNATSVAGAIIVVALTYLLRHRSVSRRLPRTRIGRFGG